MKTYKWFLLAIIFFLTDAIFAWLATLTVGNAILLISTNVAGLQGSMFNATVIMSVAYVLAIIIFFCLFWLCLITGYSKVEHPVRNKRYVPDFNTA